jgi:uncharacterized protein YceH (UPF0502 family)
MNEHQTAALLQLQAALADLKETDYKTALGLTALIDVLLEKGVITQPELARQARRLAEADEIEATTGLGPVYNLDTPYHTAQDE